MKIGFIGAGSMGSLLVDAFVRADAIRPECIEVSSRTSSKIDSLAQNHPGIRKAVSNAGAANGASLLFLCVKPMDYRQVLDEIRTVLQPDQIVVSITSPVTIAQLESFLPCKVVKIIPSVVNAAKSGASLIMWGSRLEEEDRDFLWTLFSSISKPMEIPENEIRVASDLSSCGPAFLAYLLDQFIEAAVRETGIDRALATSLAEEMMLGTARLLTEHGLTPSELQAKVSVPGGITAAAIESLTSSTFGAFENVLRTTHVKFAEDISKVHTSLFGTTGPTP